MVRISSHPPLILAAQQHLDQKQQSTELREGEGTLHPAPCQPLHILLLLPVLTRNVQLSFQPQWFPLSLG